MATDTTALQEYVKEFQELFILCSDGSLKAEWTRLQKIKAFISKHKSLIVLHTGFTINPDVQFEQPAHREIQKVQQNKLLLWNIFITCYRVFLNACHTLSITATADYSNLTAVMYKQVNFGNN